MEISLHAPAKINLRLNVLHKRPDNYHEIKTFLTRISLYDEISIKVEKNSTNKDNINISCQNFSELENSNNIIVKAIQIMHDISENYKFFIKLTKNIPMGAGLGGGSSDAGCVILGLNKLLNLGYDYKKLIEIASKIGADVPFFIKESKAIAGGIGEKLTYVENFPNYYLILIYPGFLIPTKWAYNALNQDLTKYTNPVISGKKVEGQDFYNTFIEKIIADPGNIKDFLYNDFESVCIKEYPVISKIKEILEQEHAQCALMSGSGSSVFGIYMDRETRDNVYKRLLPIKEESWRIFKAKTI